MTGLFGTLPPDAGLEAMTDKDITEGRRGTIPLSAVERYLPVKRSNIKSSKVASAAEGRFLGETALCLWRKP